MNKGNNATKEVPLDFVDAVTAWQVSKCAFKGRGALMRHSKAAVRAERLAFSELPLHKAAPRNLSASAS